MITIKKYIILFLFSFLILISSCSHPKKTPFTKYSFLEKHYTQEEITYIIESKINFYHLEQYQHFQTFQLYHYHDYEKLREIHHYTYLEAINYFNYPNYFQFYENAKKAPFKNTPLILVNKSFYLEKEDIPHPLVRIADYSVSYIIRKEEETLVKKEVMDAYQKMYDAAKEENIELFIFSGYRSYSKQEYLFFHVNNQNDSISAVPGHSEHQTGLALDISTLHYGLTSYFGDSKEYKWLIENASSFGFILRFPKEKTHITGYQYEPWHFRYIGEQAITIMSNHLTLEEFLFSFHEII